MMNDEYGNDESPLSLDYSTNSIGTSVENKIMNAERASVLEYQCLIRVG